MGRPIPAFLDEVADLLDEEILPEVYSDYCYFDKCAYRVDYDEERLKLTDLSFCERNTSGDIQRVNDTLSRAVLRLEFHFSDDEPLTGTWTEILTSFTVALHLPDEDIPSALKWEQSGDSGKLKADEWFDKDREYIKTNIGAKEAIQTAITEQLYQVIPSFRTQSRTTELPSVILQTLYHEDSDILDQLQPDNSH